MQPEQQVNILMVDDRPENLMALEAILGDLGQNLVKASSGREALRHLLEREFAVILLDVHMPVMDGYETAALIRERDKLLHTPIIFLTAMDKSDTSIFKGYSVGAVDYIFKPFAPEVLRAKVGVFIDLFKKTEEVKRQAELLRQTNRELGKTNKAIGALYKEIEQKNVELRTERDFINAVIDTAGSFVVLLNREGRIVRFNKACERASGFTFDEVRGKKMWEVLVAPEDTDAAMEMFDRVRQGEYPFAGENTWIAKRGEQRRIAWSATALHEEDGSVSYIVNTGIDITERQRAEEEIRKLNEDLERRVRDRTAQLESINTELKRAKDSAEAANHAKDQFLAVLSHELRTPLTPVLTTVQVLEEDPALPEELRVWIEIIRSNVELEARLIDDLLDLTRITQGKLQLNLDSVDVHSVIGSVIDICKTDGQNKNITLDIDLDAEASYVRGDSARLQQVFWNLVKNAIKFTPEGGRIGIRSSNTADGKIVVEVSDTGIGIEPEVLPKIFDAFEQGDRSITRLFGGLGLGLAISRTLIDAHGGTIQAGSAGKNEGATFTVELDTVDPSIPEQDGVEIRPVMKGERSNYKILIVEDNTDTSQVISHLLERRGYRVHAVTSIGGAIEAADAQEFDLVISDIGLPDGSGIDLMRKLRETKPVKGIAVSGYGMEEDVRRSLDAGFSEHLTKPISFRKLTQVIQSLLADTTGESVPHPVSVDPTVAPATEATVHNGKKIG